MHLMCSSDFLFIFKVSCQFECLTFISFYIFNYFILFYFWQKDSFSASHVDWGPLLQYSLGYPEASIILAFFP